jgi:hypothetical protein
MTSMVGMAGFDGRKAVASRAAKVDNCKDIIELLTTTSHFHGKVAPLISVSQLARLAESLYSSPE